MTFRHIRTHNRARPDCNTFIFEENDKVKLVVFGDYNLEAAWEKAHDD